MVNMKGELLPVEDTKSNTYIDIGAIKGSKIIHEGGSRVNNARDTANLETICISLSGQKKSSVNIKSNLATSGISRGRLSPSCPKNIAICVM